MNEKKLNNSSKKIRFSLSDWIKKNFLYLILISFLIYILVGQKWTKRIPFELIQDKNDKIIIAGLDENERENLNLDKGIFWTYRNSAKQYEYFIEGKNRKGLKIFRPSNYYSIGEIKPEALRLILKKNPEKGITFEGENKSLVKLILQEDQGTLLKKEKTLPAVFEKLIWIFLIILILDTFFKTKIISRIGSFLKIQKSKYDTVNLPSINFEAIGGLAEAKEELREIVTYFLNPKAFEQRGAYVPKGFLLVGPPGNGKTLLAKAFAGECKLPFIYRPAPELEKGIVGWGAAEVRRTFSLAHQYAKDHGGSVVFFDEIDVVAGKRRSLENHSDRGILTQLLVELDGFSERGKVIFIAATNSLDSLDPALLRPGRLDRHIYISLPSRIAREQIISLSLKNKPTANIDLRDLATMTGGLSGAQIVNVINEAAILSLRYGKKNIDQEIILEALDRTLIGLPNLSHVISPEKKLLIAYHESGHALTALIQYPTAVEKITINSRANAGGYTWVTLRNQKDDSYLVSEEEILAQVVSLLGGRVAEVMIYGKTKSTTGSSSDLNIASSLVQDLVLRYGMSNLGIVSARISPFSEEESLSESSELTKQKVEKEINFILKQCWNTAKNILNKNISILELFAKTLMKKGTLQKEEINYLFVFQKSFDKKKLLLK